ncbi:MAG: EAL domain-containing protein [Halieaceae bacterium]|nr:EAL domain-containing protein [Halieaceae bacterium]
MAKKTNFSLTILSVILGITAIACLVTIYINTSLKSQQIESIYIVTLISIIGLILIHVRLLCKNIGSSYADEKKEREDSGVAKVLSSHKISEEILRSNENGTQSKYLNSRSGKNSNKALDSGEKELNETTLKKYTETRDKLREMAYFDSLTSLPNRRLFTEQLDLLIKQARRTGQMLALMFIDLDNFKRINDTLGHSAGDSLLQEIALRLRRCVRESDVVTRSTSSSLRADVSRFGGDEFTLILTDLESLEATARVADRVISSVTKPVNIDDKEISITTSIGIALAPENATDVAGLLKSADTAMYHAKQQGKDHYLFYNKEMDAANVEKVILERDLREAINSEELKVVYQPQVDIFNGSITGAEALLRWDHRERGPISPSRFIPLAEDIGLISDIGEWSLKIIGEQLNKIKQIIDRPLNISINISQSQFNTRLVEYLKEMNKNNLIPLENLTLELTENILLESNETNLRLINSLKSMGVLLSIDDFGTGFSSLSYLTKLPLDQLKIDRSFVLNLFNEENSGNIISAIIAMTSSLNLELVCEGVENKLQCEFLGSKGAKLFQGYLFSEPVSGDKLSQMLKPGFYLDQLTLLKLAETNN